MVSLGGLKHGCLLLALWILSGAAASKPSWINGELCRIEGRMFDLDFGWTKSPTKAAVILPGGKLLRLRDPASGIDTLGPSYPRGHVHVEAASLMGVDHAMRRVPVFTVAGKYEFLFQDANTAEGMDLHRANCIVTLSDQEARAIGSRVGN